MTESGGHSHRETGLRFYLGVVRRRWKLMLLCLLLPVAAAIAASSAQEKLYQGEAQVVLSRQNLANALTRTPDPSSAAFDFLRIVQTQADVARSPVVAANVLDRADIVDMSASDFLAMSTVAPERDSDILTFTVADEDPVLAADLANFYALEFTAYRRQLDTEALEAARAEIQKRLESPSESLDSIDEGDLEEQLQKLQTLETLQTANASVISGSTEAVQVRPRWTRNLILSIFLGLGLAGLAAWIRESLDTRVRTPDEVADWLHVPFLGRIHPPGSQLDGQLQMAVQPYGPDAEAFRALRTNIEFAMLDSSIRSIMVTSATEAEGKSTTIANLALAFARAGKSVVLVDLDLRKRSIPGLLGLRSDAGITDVSIGRLELSRALQSVEINAHKTRPDGSTVKTLSRTGTLRLLQGGSTPPDPGEFLGSPSVDQILKRLSGDYDLVLIDAPPVLAVGDVLSMSPAVDAMILTTRLPVVKRPMLAAMARTLAQAPSKVLGFVVTGRSPGGSAYGYGAYGTSYGVSERAREMGSLAADHRPT